MFALMVRSWIKHNPEIVLAFEVDKDVVTIVAWNADKTRILRKFTLDEIDQSRVIAAALPLVSASAVKVGQ